MKICIVGSFHLSIGLANALVNVGHEIHLIPGQRPREVHSGVIVHDEFIGHLENASLLSSILFFYTAIRFSAKIRRIRPDVLHAFFIPWQGWYAALSGYHPFALTTMGSDITFHGGTYKNAFHRFLNPFTVRVADAVTVVNEHGRRRVMEMDPRKSPVVFRAGFDPQLFFPSRKPPSLIERWRLDDSMVFLSPRSMDRELYKIDSIVGAFRLFLDAGGKGILMILGNRDSACAANIGNLVSKLGLDSSTRFCGVVPQSLMRDYYNASDAVVSIPRIDGAPATVFECYACAKPLIVARNNSILEIFQDRVNGFIVDPDNRAQIAEAMLAFYRDRGLVKRVGENNLRESRKYEFQTFVRAIEEVYRTLVV